MKVTIENLEGRLRLRWTCPETGKRKNLALGLNDGISGRGEAARVKAWIETDARNKTKKGRTVPLDPSIASMLSTRRDLLKPASDDELVFTSREGLPIDNGNFRRLWRIVLAEVGVPYRKPYTTRKTSVRHSLLSGANYIEVAAAAGHDPHTMHKYYGDAIQQNSVLRATD